MSLAFPNDECQELSPFDSIMYYTFAQFSREATSQSHQVMEGQVPRPVSPPRHPLQKYVHNSLFISHSFKDMYIYYE